MSSSATPRRTFKVNARRPRLALLVVASLAAIFFIVGTAVAATADTGYDDGLNGGAEGMCLAAVSCIES